MSPPKIYLVRHAEAEHNVSKDFSHRDPGLTALGKSQASELAAAFPDQDSIAAVLTSPLTRTLETTLAGFGHILNSNSSIGGGGSSSSGDDGKPPRLIVDPDLQERSDLPCDTGSDPDELRRRVPGLFGGGGGDGDALTGLADGWHEKRGAYAADDASVAARAARVRGRLRDLVVELGEEAGSSVVVVTHGVFMKFLSQDDTIDLPKAGWKAFTVESGAGGDARLVPV